MSEVTHEQIEFGLSLLAKIAEAHAELSVQAANQSEQIQYIAIAIDEINTRQRGEGML